MEPANSPFEVIRFATYEVNVQAGELRKSGVKVRLGEQPFRLLVSLLERPGQVVTRNELQKRLWPDTFVDVDGGLNAAVNKVREALSDSADNPRFVETVARRGYRFIAPLETPGLPAQPKTLPAAGFREVSVTTRARLPMLAAVVAIIAAVVAVGSFLLKRKAAEPSLHSLTRLTFDDGLQIGATWSPDGRYIAYASDRGGKFDIWVQQVSGGTQIRVTNGPGNHWQPDWSRDGKYIVYRSEGGGGGLFVIPALGGDARQVSSFGYYPSWSPDNSRILFRTHPSMLDLTDRFYVVGLDGRPPQLIATSFLSENMSDFDLHANAAAWHPDGKRITVWTGNRVAPTFWTVPIEGGPAIKTELPAEAAKEVASLSPFAPESDARFAWTPSGSAIFFERTYRGAKNIWRMNVDPQSLRGLIVQRVTTGAGVDTDFSISPDGRRLAFTSETRHVRAWLFPLDASHARISGPGQAVTSLGTEAMLLALTRDGSKLAFGGRRGSKLDLWQKMLPDGAEALVVPEDSHGRYNGQWSPDGNHLAYWREDLPSGGGQIVVWSQDTHVEEPITKTSGTDWVVSDWSPDGKYILATLETSEHDRTETWMLPAGVAGGRDSVSRKIVSDPAGYIYQSHFSPDGRWIVFEDVKDTPMGIKSSLFAIPASGGSWIRITDGNQWDDKPRFGPDGRTVYFVSGRSGFYNVWGRHFDFEKGAPLGDPFPVTSLDKPSLMVLKDIASTELSVAKDRFVIPVEQVSGSIWLMDN
jgi:Tol biopolymer transport system component/DNA-binding winged helix-turn-helix (wHTH) protein